MYKKAFSKSLIFLLSILVLLASIVGVQSMYSFAKSDNNISEYSVSDIEISETTQNDAQGILFGTQENNFGNGIQVGTQEDNSVDIQIHDSEKDENQVNGDLKWNTDGSGLELDKDKFDNVKNSKVTITLVSSPSLGSNNEHGFGGTETVEATYGQYLPQAAAPTRQGYTFKGYWTGDMRIGIGDQFYEYGDVSIDYGGYDWQDDPTKENNAMGLMYYDEHMQPTKVWDLYPNGDQDGNALVHGVKLYAMWRNNNKPVGLGEALKDDSSMGTIMWLVGAGALVFVAVFAFSVIILSKNKNKRYIVRDSYGFSDPWNAGGGRGKKSRKNQNNGMMNQYNGNNGYGNQDNYYRNDQNGWW